MPIYEYACPHCHKTFEEWLRSAEDQTDIMPCPVCGQAAPRIISQTTFILKGGGWYVTEYGGHPASEDGDTTEAQATDTSGDVSADASGDTSGGEKSDDKTSAAKPETAANSSVPAYGQPPTKPLTTTTAATHGSAPTPTSSAAIAAASA